MADWKFAIVVTAVLTWLFALKRLSLIAADKAQEYLRNGALVVDVRSPGEFNVRHLPGAINLPLGTVTLDAERNLKDKSQTILLHCLSGTRSAIAKRQLKRLGYHNVFNLGSYARAEKLVREVAKKSGIIADSE